MIGVAVEVTSREASEEQAQVSQCFLSLTIYIGKWHAKLSMRASNAEAPKGTAEGVFRKGLPGFASK